MDSVFPSIEGRRGMKASVATTAGLSAPRSLACESWGGSSTFNWSKLLKVIIAVLTALAGSLGVVSCV